MRSTSIVASTVVFAVLAATAGGLYLVKRNQKASAAAAAAVSWEPPESVLATTAREIDWQPTAELVGSAFSLRSVRISNELAGTIKKVGYGSGTIVEPGDVLLTLEDSTERADLAAAEAMVAVAQANVEISETRLALAESEWRRMDEAGSERAVSPIEMDRGRSEVARAKADRAKVLAEVEQAKAHVAQVQTMVDKHVVKAPFRGRTGIRTVHEGQYLPEGTQLVMLEEVTDSIYLDFAIPQEHLTRVRPGLAVMASSPVLGPTPVRIEVVAVDATVSNDTRNARVRGLVDNRDGRILPGMFVRIRVPVGEPERHVVVPATAVRRASFGDHVFIVAPSKNPKDQPGALRAQQRFVKVGPSVGEDVIITEGLAAGETLATTGSFKLRDGALVVDASAVPPQASGTETAAGH
ncbi:MAG: efflux RND transporter periplasmic adaptor subunit [Phycisphaerae bacterium]|nr:efflux RND transporter periplasmic adaptor subunit [Phycisphaerae bacterium]